MMSVSISTINSNKRFRASNVGDFNILQKISQQVTELQLNFSERIGFLENKLDLLVTCYSELLEKVENDQIHCNVKSEMINNELEMKIEHECCRETLVKLSNIENMLGNITDVNPCAESQKPVKISEESNSSFLTVLLPQKKPKVEAQLSLDSSMQVITLNSESDFPNGSWLGDESNPEARVRVPISPAQLLHINTHCSTPGKMAIVLVDYLFSKEILATSNLSGKGRHCKKQLDPLMIYGIRSHLFYKFNITEKDWYRIKQNIDSKCRTAWRKKVRGMILGDNKNPVLTSNYSNKSDCETANRSFILSRPLASEEIVEGGESGVVRTNRSHFKIVRATPEQVAKLQESHTVKVFTNEDADIFSPNPMLSSSCNIKSDNESTNRPFRISRSLVSEEVVEDSDSGVVRTNRGHIKIVRATPAQMAKLQESHTVKVFTNEDVAEMFSPSQMFSVEDMDSYTLTGCGEEQTLTIVTENGEVNIPILSAEDSMESDSQFMNSDP